VGTTFVTGVAQDCQAKTRPHVAEITGGAVADFVLDGASGNSVILRDTSDSAFRSHLEVPVRIGIGEPERNLCKTPFYVSLEVT
jgi:hypothetical protein